MLSFSMSPQWRNFLLIVALAGVEAAGHLVFPARWSALIGPVLIILAGAIRSYLPHTVVTPESTLAAKRFCQKCGVVVAALALLFVPPALMSACDAFRAVEPSVAKVAECILDHDDLAPEAIAAACGGIAVTEVISVLNASRRSQVRRQLRDHARDAGAE